MASACEWQHRVQHIQDIVAASHLRPLHARDWERAAWEKLPKTSFQTSRPWRLSHSPANLSGLSGPTPCHRIAHLHMYTVVQTGRSSSFSSATYRKIAAKLPARPPARLLGCRLDQSSTPSSEFLLQPCSYRVL